MRQYFNPSIFGTKLAQGSSIYKDVSLQCNMVWNTAKWHTPGISNQNLSIHQISRNAIRFLFFEIIISWWILWECHRIYSEHILLPLSTPSIITLSTYLSLYNQLCVFLLLFFFMKSSLLKINNQNFFFLYIKPLFLLLISVYVCASMTLWFYMYCSTLVPYKARKGHCIP